MREVPRESAAALLNPRVSAAFSAIKSAQATLDAVRATCSHDTYFVGWYAWRSGLTAVKRVCAVCHQPAGDPSEEERARVGVFGGAVGGWLGAQ